MAEFQAIGPDGQPQSQSQVNGIFGQVSSGSVMTSQAQGALGAVSGGISSVGASATAALAAAPDPSSMMGSVYGPTGLLGGVAAQTGEAMPDDMKSGVPGFSSMTDKLKGFMPGGSSLFNPSQARLSLAGLLGNGADIKPLKAASANWTNGSDLESAPQDWRVKVSVAAGSGILYDLESNNLLTPIFNTGGVIFPISPQIQTTHTAKYTSQSLTHSNYAMQFYEGSEVAAITITAEFPVQNIAEGQYLLAAIYFFRAATKMYWGKDDWAGTPPPMVFLSGYGSHYFPNVPCVLTQFMHTMPEDKDFIEVPTPGTSRSGKTTRLPTQSTIQITLQPIYSRAAVTQFNLDEFADGKMLGGGFI